MIMDIEQSYQQGFQLRCEGNYSAAKDALQRVLAQDPRHVDARHQLALIDGFIGDFDGSVANLQKLADENPMNLNIRYDLAMSQMMIGMNDEACANFNYILRINPMHEKAMQQSAYC